MSSEPSELKAVHPAERLHRYPGPPPFEDTPEDQAIFFGRDAESETTTQLILASRVVTMFGKSGLGKTSLFNAGVFPRLRKQAFFPVRIRVSKGKSPVSLVSDALTQSAAGFATDHTIPNVATLWQMFKLATFWRDGTLLTPVLVFDQFEEIFTTLNSNERTALAEEIGTLVSGNMPAQVRTLQHGLAQQERMSDSPPEVKVILVLRDDYLAALQELTVSIPQLFQNRVRLLPLSDEQATVAIRKPALVVAPRFKTEPFEYGDDAIKVLLDFLRGRSGDIEPWELQIICAYVEREVVPKAGRTWPKASGALRIASADLGGPEALPRILRSFYEAEMAKLPGAQGRRARELCDTGLVSDEGHRLSLERQQILCKWRVTGDTLDRLVKARLLRREPRLESTSYEISHDTLAKTILDHRPFRVPRERRAAVLVTAIALAAIAAVTVSKGHSLSRERQLAEDARGKADDLLTFLIGEDLLDKARRSGQFSVLRDVRERVDNYAREAANQRPNVATKRARALVWLVDGELAFREGNLDNAQGSYTAALNLLRQLHRDEPSAPRVSRALAQALEYTSDMDTVRKGLDEALKAKKEALALRELLAQDTTTSAKEQELAQQKRVADVTDLASLLRRQGQLAEAAKQLGTILPTIKKHSDASASLEWTYVVADAYMELGDIATRQGDLGTAEKAQKQSHRTAEQLTRLAPFEWKARYDYVVALLHLFRTDPDAISEGDIALENETARQVEGPALPDGKEPLDNATPSIQQTAAVVQAPRRRDLLVYLKIHETIQVIAAAQPENQAMARDLAASGLLLGEVQMNTAKQDALKTYTRSLNRLEQLSVAQPTNHSLLGDLAWAHRDIAEATSDLAEKRAHLNAARRETAELAQLDPSNRDNAYDRVGIELQIGRLAGGKEHDKEAGAAYSRGKEILAQLRGVDPTDKVYSDLKIACEQQDSPIATGSASESAALRAAEAAGAALKANPGKPQYLATHAEAFLRLGDIQALLKHAKDAEKSYDVAEASLKRAIDNPESEGVKLEEAKDLDLLALVYRGRAGLRAGKNPRSAVEAYRRAADYFTEAIGLQPQDHVLQDNFADVQELLGDLLEHRADLGGALAAYEKAEKAYNKSLTLDESAVTRNRLYFLQGQRIAPLQKKRGDRRAEMAALKKAIDEADHAVKLASNDAAYLSNRSSGYRALGDALQASDPPDLPGAQHAYDQAEKDLLKTTQIEVTAAATALRWNSLFLLRYDAMAPLKQKRGGSNAELVDTYQESAAALEKATELDPENPVYYSNLYVVSGQIGQLLQDNKEALVERRKALDAISKAAAINPKNTQYQSNVVRAHLELGRALARLNGDPQSLAVREYDRAVETAARLVSKALKDKLAVNLLALSYLEKANALEAHGDLTHALEAYAKGIDQERRAIALDGNEPLFRKNLYSALIDQAKIQERKNPADALVTYQEARDAMNALVKLAPGEEPYGRQLQDVKNRIAEIERSQSGAP